MNEELRALGLCRSCTLILTGLKILRCRLKKIQIVIERLRKQIIQTNELANGYAFKFAGTDKMVDELIEFIKTERACCSFFTFTLSISGDQSEVWLELTGAERIKDFMKAGLEL